MCVRHRELIVIFFNKASNVFRNCLLLLRFTLAQLCKMLIYDKMKLGNEITRDIVCYRHEFVKTVAHKAPPRPCKLQLTTIVQIYLTSLWRLTTLLEIHKTPFKKFTLYRLITS